MIAEYITGVQSPGVNEPPMRGVVTAEDEAGAVVLWQNAELTQLPEFLLRLVAGMPEEVRALIGKYVQLTGWPTNTVGTPKSPGASGLVLDAVTHGPFGEGPDRVDLVIATENGEQFVTVSDVFDFDTSELRSDIPIRVDFGRREV